MRYIDPFALKLAQDLVADVVITNAAPVLCLAPRRLTATAALAAMPPPVTMNSSASNLAGASGMVSTRKIWSSVADTEADDTGLVSHYERPVLQSHRRHGHWRKTRPLPETALLHRHVTSCAMRSCG